MEGSMMRVTMAELRAAGASIEVERQGPSVSDMFGSDEMRLKLEWE